MKQKSKPSYVGSLKWYFHDFVGSENKKTVARITSKERKERVLAIVEICKRY